MDTATRLAALSALVLSALPAAAAPLARATHAMVEVTQGEATYKYEKGIAPDDAGAIAAHLRGRGESNPEIVRVPGRRGTFLASDFGGGTGEDVGRCLFLLQATRGGVKELARTRGSGDAYNLTPVVFSGGGRTIVLAELGTEYSWGVRVFEVAGSSLRELGAIDAGIPGELGEQDPTPYAKVSLDAGHVVVRFDKDLVLGTGKQGAPVAKKPVVFRQQGDGFVRVEARGKAKRGP